MKISDLAQALARQAALPEAAAAEQVDQVVHEIVQKLRRGKAVRLPGLGTLIAKPSRQKAIGSMKKGRSKR
jgi:nucleoid DNA-binding protein